jgi:hypothetical protein
MVWEVAQMRDLGRDDARSSASLPGLVNEFHAEVVPNWGSFRRYIAVV